MGLVIKQSEIYWKKSNRVYYQVLLLSSMRFNGNKSNRHKVLLSNSVRYPENKSSRQYCQIMLSSSVGYNGNKSNSVIRFCCQVILSCKSNRQCYWVLLSSNLSCKSKRQILVLLSSCLIYIGSKFNRQVLSGFVIKQSEMQVQQTNISSAIKQFDMY